MGDVIQQHIEAIEQQVQIAEAGYKAFRSMYAQTNRMPDKKTYVSRLGVIRSALIVIMIASSVVSASHTIPTFADGPEGREGIAVLVGLVVGIAAFCMSELALATFAYIGVMRHYRETSQEPNSLKTLVKLGVVIPFVVMGAANINHEFKINDIQLPTIVTSGIILAISLSAPMMGYISGECFAMFEVIDQVDREKNDATYAEQKAAWEEKARAAWGREKGNYGGRVRVDPVPTPSIPSIPMETIGMETVENRRIIPAASSIGHSKQPMATQIVTDYFTANPDALNGNAIEIAKQLGVGKSTVYTIMKEMRS